MIKYSHFYIFIVLFGALNACKGQSKTAFSTPTISFEVKELATEIVPQSISRNICQDKNGIIWIAAFDGVFRYDGKTFTNVMSTVSSARFFSVLEDSKGNLWFGSIGSGVYQYDGKTFRQFTTKDGLLNNEVGSMCEDKLGNIWFGTNGGTSCYNGKKFKNFMITGETMQEDWTGKTLPNIRPPNEVTAIIEDKTGRLWFCTRGNTFVYDGVKFTVLKHQEKAFRNVRTIIEDKKGNIWFGGNDGLWRYANTTFTNITERFVGHILEDKSGNIWTSSENTSPDKHWVLSRYEAKHLSDIQPTATEIQPKAGMLFGLLEDNQGKIWFGTGEGVYRLDGHIITKFKGKEEPK